MKIEYKHSNTIFNQRLSIVYQTREKIGYSIKHRKLTTNLVNVNYTNNYTNLHSDQILINTKRIGETKEDKGGKTEENLMYL